MFTTSITIHTAYYFYHHPYSVLLLSPSIQRTTSITIHTAYHFYHHPYSVLLLSPSIQLTTSITIHTAYYFYHHPYSVLLLSPSIQRTKVYHVFSMGNIFWLHSKTCPPKCFNLKIPELVFSFTCILLKQAYLLMLEFLH